ncbi:hypothetical protein SDJN02_06762, partial [Cucurbita argyrosperma subsp. argyrosperma]
FDIRLTASRNEDSSSGTRYSLSLAFDSNPPLDRENREKLTEIDLRLQESCGDHNEEPILHRIQQQQYLERHHERAIWGHHRWFSQEGLDSQVGSSPLWLN